MLRSVHFFIAHMNVIEIAVLYLSVLCPVGFKIILFVFQCGVSILIKMELPLTQQFYSQEYILRILKHQYKKNMHPMFIAALFTVAEIWKQPKCPSVDKCLQKLQYICTMEYYAAVKKKLLHFATVCIDLENICKQNKQSEKDTA